MATFTRQIAATADDGYISGASAYGTTEVGVGNQNGPGSISAWLRFANVTIPQGSYIFSAQITFQQDSGSGSTVRTKIYGVDEDNHAAPTNRADWSTDHGLHTTAMVVWNFTPGTLVTPDLTTIIQELIDRPGWVSGNALGIHIDDNGSAANNYQTWTDYGTVPGSAALLTIVYSLGPPNAPTLTAPTGASVWDETSTQALTYTIASPEHPDGTACTYEFQFSAAGTFADAVDITNGVTGGSYSWTLPNTLVGSDTATCKVRVRARDVDDRTSIWTTSDAFDVYAQGAGVTLVSPADDSIVQGLLPVIVLGTVDHGRDVHAELQISSFADYRLPIVDTNSIDDYLNWETATSPYSTWNALDSGGAPAGDRVRYATTEAFLYDVYYGRARLRIGTGYFPWVEFNFTLSSDASAALSVTIGGTAFKVGVCSIVENTGGEASPIELEIPLSAYLAHPLTQGDAIAISSGLGGWARSWNGTLETVTFSGSVVRVYGLQDDAYLSRKMATGNEASADLGQNLADFVTSYGSPLTGTAIDTATGVTMALTGGYKYLREHFSDALNVLPSYIIYVDAGGDIHFVDQADLPAVTYLLLEENPS